jgi:hypothetical protein
MMPAAIASGLARRKNMIARSANSAPQASLTSVPRRPAEISE